MEINRSKMVVGYVGYVGYDIMIEKTDTWAEDAAYCLLEMLKRLKYHNYPEPTCVLVTWKNGIYIGVIQTIVPTFSKEIVFLSKSSNPIGYKVADAIRKMDNGIFELIADDILDLTGRYHVVRRLENKLVKMTSEQTVYMVNHPMRIEEVDLKKILK